MPGFNKDTWSSKCWVYRERPSAFQPSLSERCEMQMFQEYRAGMLCRLYEAWHACIVWKGGLESCHAQVHQSWPFSRKQYQPVMVNYSCSVLIGQSRNVTYSMQGRSTMIKPCKQTAERNTLQWMSPWSVQRLSWVSGESLFEPQFKLLAMFSHTHTHIFETSPCLTPTCPLRRNQQISLRRCREKNRSSIQSVSHYLLTMRQSDGNQRGIPVSALKSEPNYSKLLACP